MTRFSVVLAALLLMLTVLAGADIPVTPHLHGPFGDGIQGTGLNISNAVDHGARAVIVTEHLEMLNREAPQGFVQDWLGETFAILENNFITKRVFNEVKVVKQCGVARYLATIEQVGHDFAKKGIRVIPGGEIGAGPRRHNHLLILGGDSQIYNQLTELADNIGDNSTEEQAQATFVKVAQIAHASGAAVIAAHPTMKYPLDSISYPFKVQGGYLDGVEFMNHGSEDSDTDVAAYWQDLCAKYRQQFVITTGADYHGEQALANLQLNRHVVVRTNNPDEIVSCIRTGNDYIVNDGVTLTSTDLPIGNVISTDKKFYVELVGMGSDTNWSLYFVSTRGEKKTFHGDFPQGSQLRLTVDCRSNFNGDIGQALLLIGGRFGISFRVTAPENKPAERPAVVANNDDEPLGDATRAQLQKELDEIGTKASNIENGLSPAGKERLKGLLGSFVQQMELITEQRKNKEITRRQAREVLDIVRAFAKKTEEIAQAEAGGDDLKPPAEMPKLEPVATEQPVIGTTNRIPTGDGVFYGEFLFSAGEMRVWLDINTRILYTKPPGLSISYERLPALQIVDRAEIRFYTEFEIKNVIGIWPQFLEWVKIHGRDDRQRITTHIYDTDDPTLKIVFDLMFVAEHPDRPDDLPFLAEVTMKSVEFYRNGGYCDQSPDKY